MQNRFRGVIPELPVPDVDAALGYYRDVLGFSIAGRHADASGLAVFGSVLCGEANLYFSRTTDPITPVRSWVFVDEVDELCPRFRSRGARILADPADQPWGYRQFTIADLNGHILNFFRFIDG